MPMYRTGTKGFNSKRQKFHFLTYILTKIYITVLTKETLFTILFLLARMVELVDTLGSGPRARKGVQVQVLFRALRSCSIVTRPFYLLKDTTAMKNSTEGKDKQDYAYNVQPEGGIIA